MTVSAIALLGALGGPAAAPRCAASTRAVPRASLGALAGGAAGLGVSAALRVSGFLPNVVVVLFACVCTVLGFGLVVFGLDGGELGSLVSRARAGLAR